MSLCIRIFFAEIDAGPHRHFCAFTHVLHMQYSLEYLHRMLAFLGKSGFVHLCICALKPLLNRITCIHNNKYYILHYYTLSATLLIIDTACKTCSNSELVGCASAMGLHSHSQSSYQLSSNVIRYFLYFPPSSRDLFVVCLHTGLHLSHVIWDYGLLHIQS